MNFKAFAAAAAITATGLVANTAPAQAFWGPSDQEVCEANVSFIQKTRQQSMDQVGMGMLGQLNWNGKVIATDRVQAAPVMGKFVTGCQQVFTMDDGTSYVQQANVYLQGDQYYVGLAPAIPFFN